MDRNLALEFVRITEAAALNSSKFMGLGQKDAADQAAVDAMRRAFDDVMVQGVVVIGEGERDEAPMLYIGEKVGCGDAKSPQIDIALDPLEGTNLCAYGAPGAISVIAVAERGNFLHAPDTYMDKIAVGPKAKGVINIDATVEENIFAVSKALGKEVNELTAVVLNRPRHEVLIKKLRDLNVRINLIEDGDVSAALATAWEDSGIDILMGTGGAPEGVITAAAMKCLEGDFQGRLKFRNEDEKMRAKKMGVSDFDKALSIDDLAKGDVMFIATGITSGPLLKGVRYISGGRALTESIVMRSKTGTIRKISATHTLEKKPKQFR